MSTVANYVGRTVDLLAWDWPYSLSGTVLLTPTLAIPGGGGKIISGIGKLAQRFLLELLTEQGSMQYQPTRGTVFMTSLRMGAIRTSHEAEQLFYSALTDIKRNLRLDQTANDPLDEQLDSATLVGISLSGETLSMNIEILSQAGTTRSVLLPLKTSIEGA